MTRWSVDCGLTIGRWMACLAFAFVAGCGDVDWNWDVTWWKTPKRVVRPSEPRRPSSTGSPSTTSRPSGGQQLAGAEGATEPPTSPERVAATPPPSRPTLPEAAARPKPAPRDRPFYQLYLASPSTSTAESTLATQPREGEAENRSGGVTAPPEDRGEHRQVLHEAPAGACAGLLEMLYVPAGRSGSPSECYLLYEDPDEFDAAVQMAALLDIAPAEHPADAVGPEAAFRAGVTLLLYIVEQGTHVERGLVDACEQHLAQALQSADLPPQLRWAAGILAARVVAEYRYDYPTARSYCRQAERAAAPQSLEQMAALWWQADACLQQGDTGEASKLYRRIVTDFEDKYKNAHIVRRAKANLSRRKS